MNLQSMRQLMARHNLQPGRALATLLLAAFAVAVFAGSALAAGNLVKNGSFEKATNGIPNWWGWFGFTPADKRVCNQSKAGACSFRMVADGAFKNLEQCCLPISGLAGDEFTLSVWTKSKAFDLGLGNSAYVYVLFSYPGGGSNYDYFDIPTGTTAWTLIQVSAVADDAYDTMEVGVQFNYPGSGKVWFDKVKLVEVP